MPGKKKKEEAKIAPAETTMPDKDSKEVQVAEQVIQDRKIASHDAFGKLSRPAVELIKRTVAQGASDDELKLFITVCHGAQLNPFLRQAHLVPFWDSKTGTERRAIIVGIDGFRAIAESSEKYAGNDDIVFEGEGAVNTEKQGQVKHPESAKSTVWKVIEGSRFAFSATARWSEYYPGGKKAYQWNKMPYLMLGKCAESLALRKAFPKLLSGIYAPEEMDQAQSADPQQVEQVKVQQGFKTLLKYIATADAKGMNEMVAKMEKSDKYSEAQKKEFLQAVEARIAEIEKAAIETADKTVEIES